MPASLQTDVLLVGAGPTGLSLASQLIRLGVDFILIDQGEGITPYSKAVGVQARTLEIYDQIGLADALIGAGTIAQNVKLIEGGEVRGTVELATIGKGLSPYPFLLLIEQNKHEDLLYDFLKAHGQEVRWKTDLQMFSQTDEGVTATVTTAGGEPRTIEANYLVGCDGARSSVRRGLGLTFEGSTMERLFYVADVHIDWKLGHQSVMICLSKDVLTAFFPLPGENRYRIVGTFPEGDQRQEGTVLYEEIEGQIKASTQLELDIKQVNWFSTYKVHSRRVDSFSKGRCFVAGDAAHIHTPAGAQGMNTGIQDGYNLAWKLALVLKNGADARLLETYNEERGENAKHLLETTDRMFEFGASSDWFLAYFRTHVMPHVAHFVLGLDAVKKIVFPLISQIGINYRSSSLSKAGGGSRFKMKVGDRIPYVEIKGESIYRALQSPCFHLITFGDSSVDWPTANEQPGDGLIDYQTFPLSPEVQTLFGTDKPFSVLLRPDNYIAFIDSEISPERLQRYLSDAMGVSVA